MIITELKFIRPKEKFIKCNSSDDYKELIGVDSCVASEIEHLWDLGIRTCGCCCGHKLNKGFIQVVDEDIPKMIELGYDKYVYKDCSGGSLRDDAFIPKTKCECSINGFIDILGQEYRIIEESKDKNSKLLTANGLCEQYSKKIIISDFKEEENERMLVENFEEYRKKLLRHEIIHAFLGESGLRGSSDFAENEEMVDWFAIQIPKIVKALQEMRCL